MKRSQQGLEGDGHNNEPSLLHEVPYQDNLGSTQSLDSISSSDNRPQQVNRSHDLREKFFNFIDYLNSTSNPPATSEKSKAMNFPAFKITIGQWTYVAVYPDDILVKVYFARKRLIWELLVPEEIGTSNTTRLKKKMEIKRGDILSLRAKFHETEDTEILEVELGIPPTFFVETNQESGKHTKWKKTDHDFTQNQSSICRRHQLCFEHGVLQTGLKKLVSCCSFWSELFKVTFPLHDSIYFDSGYGNNNIDNSVTDFNSGYGENNITNTLTDFNSGYGDNNINNSLTDFKNGYGNNNINHSLTDFKSGYGNNNINHSLTDFKSGYGDDNNINHSLTNFKSGYGNNINHSLTDFKSGYGDNNINNSLTNFNSGYGNNNINISLTYFNSGYGNNNINNPLTYNHDKTLTCNDNQILSFNNVNNANLNHHFQGSSFGHYPSHFKFEADLNPVGVDKGPDPVGVDEGVHHMANQVLANDGEICVECLMEVCSLHFSNELKPSELDLGP